MEREQRLGKYRSYAVVVTASIAGVVGAAGCVDSQIDRITIVHCPGESNSTQVAKTIVGSPSKEELERIKIRTICPTEVPIVTNP